jgi:hypothetical protein
MKNFLPAMLFVSTLALADDSLTLNLPECLVRLERRSVEAEVVLVRPGCPLATASLARMLDEGSRWMFAAGAEPVQSVYLGRLADYPEWARQLALAAAGSGRWDVGKGKPRDRSQNSNAMVVELLNGPAFPDPLRTVFARNGFTPCIGSVEKVLVFAAREALRPLPSGISPEARLPVDAQVWLNLRTGSVTCDRKAAREN